MLESNDDKLVNRIKSSEDIMHMVRDIAERDVQSDDEAASEDGEAEVVALARRCLEIGDAEGGKKILAEG